MWHAGRVRGPRDTARPVAVALVLLGALALTALAARSERSATVTAVPTVAATPGSGPTEVGPPAPEEESEAGQDTSTDTMPGWLVWLLATVAVAPFVAGLLFLRALAWVPRFRIRLGRRRRAPPPPPDTVEDEVPAARLAAAVDAGLRGLDQGGPGEGVVASWVLLERAAAEAGTHRAAPETPSELVTRLLDRHAVSSGPLLRLADRYREARFSRHELPESARAEARAALEQLRAELAASPIGGRR